MDTESEWWETKSLLPFSAPTTILSCGSTQSGKTHFTKRLLQNADGMFSTPVDKIIYAYSEFQPMFDEMMSDIPRLIFHQGLPSTEDIEQYTESKSHNSGIRRSYATSCAISRLRTIIYGDFSSP